MQGYQALDQRQLDAQPAFGPIDRRIRRKHSSGTPFAPELRPPRTEAVPQAIGDSVTENATAETHLTLRLCDAVENLRAVL